MSTASISSSAAATSTASTSASAASSALSSLGAEDFLKLLLVELQNQVPTDPVDLESMTEQLSSLGQLLESEKTNEYLADLSNSASYQAVNFIGKTISFENADNAVSAGSAEVTGIVYTNGVPYLITEYGQISLASVTAVS